MRAPMCVQTGTRAQIFAEVQSKMFPLWFLRQAICQELVEFLPPYWLFLCLSLLQLNCNTTNFTTNAHSLPLHPGLFNGTTHINVSVKRGLPSYTSSAIVYSCSTRRPRLPILVLLISPPPTARNRGFSLWHSNLSSAADICFLWRHTGGGHRLGFLGDTCHMLGRVAFSNGTILGCLWYVFGLFVVNPVMVVEKRYPPPI